MREITQKYANCGKKNLWWQVDQSFLKVTRNTEVMGKNYDLLLGRFLQDPPLSQQRTFFNYANNYEINMDDFKQGSSVKGLTLKPNKSLLKQVLN